MADPAQQPQPAPDAAGTTNPTAQAPHPPPGGAAPPPGGYYPPPQGHYPGYYPPPPGQYPPPAGAPPPGHYPPPGAPPPGQYPPPAGAPPPGQHPPGQYPPPAGAPPPGQYPSPPGAPPPGQQPPAAGTPGQHPPPPGAPPGQPGYPGYAWPGYPPPGGYPGYPPPPGAPGQQQPYYGYPGYAPPYGAPPQGYGHYPPPHGGYPAPGAPGAPQAPSTPQPGQPPASSAYQPPPAMPGYPAPIAPPMPDSGAPSALAAQREVWYLGTRIADPDVPPAALTVTKLPGYDPFPDYSRISTMKSNWSQRFQGMTEMTFIKFVLELPLLSRDALSDYCVAKRGQDLYDYLQDSSPRTAISSTHVTTVARALCRGPLKFDVELLYSALSGVGANEMILTEIILNRSHEELAILNKAYTQTHGRELSKHIAAQSDVSLSSDLKKLFTMALNNQRDRSLTVDHAAVSTDVETLIRGRKGKEDSERVKFIEIFVNRSKPHLAAVITGFGQKSKSLSSVIKDSKYFPNDFKIALLFILHGIKPKRDGQGIWRDAKLLEKTMAGMGTKDTILVYRLIRAHWDPTRFASIKTAYQNHYNKSLEKRVSSETSGNYKDTLLLLINHQHKATPEPKK